MNPSTEPHDRAGPSAGAADRAELARLHELYTTVQVSLEAVSHNRTSIITLTHGLLLVAYNASVISNELRPGGLAVSLLGFVLALLWLAFEQRSHIFFRGRSTLLRQIERRIQEIDKEATGTSEFRGMWSLVPAWVSSEAKWYERFSAQSVLRVWIPGIFAVVWMALIVVTSLAMLGSPSGAEPEGESLHISTGETGQYEFGGETLDSEALVAVQFRSTTTTDDVSSPGGVGADTVGIQVAI